ncbi:MAG: asparagine synthetase B [Candidatus Omnitrophica bacterium]|nr:asparagine synthetase B [Candidatus Omnitrophota bacterium]
MCGIFGGVGVTEEEVRQGLLHIKRGEDGITVHTNGEVVLGSRRHLVKESHKPVGRGESDQPYDSDDGKVHLVFNGELFNFAALKDDLSKENIPFHTDGDTEVFLKLYERYGKDFVKDRRIDSMFAIGIHDERLRKIFVTRDWPGRVPLFYYYDPANRVFLFSSELKGFRPLSRIDLAKPVELVPGQILILDLDTFKLDVEHYYRPKPVKTSLPLLKVGEELHAILKRSAKNRTMGDVPICTMLSGGIDSLMTTWYVLSSIDFKKVGYQPTSYVFAIEGYDSPDVKRARVAAHGFRSLGLRLREIRVPGEQVVRDIPDIIEIFETRKIKALSVYPLPIYYYLAPEMRKDGFKVTIGGHGVDELLGAYDAWKELDASHRVQINTKSRLIFINAIYENMLRRASIIFMNRGPIEARFPFLEVRVCEYCLGIDQKWLSLNVENAGLLVGLIDKRGGPRNTWTGQLAAIYDHLIAYLDNNGAHPESTDKGLRHEVEKLFWKLPLIVAGMYAVEESSLPFSTLFNAKLRGQHGSGLTSLEPRIVERYRDLGATDGEIFKSIVDKAFCLK